MLVHNGASESPSRSFYVDIHRKISILHSKLVLCTVKLRCMGPFRIETKTSMPISTLCGLFIDLISITSTTQTF